MSDGWMTTCPDCGAPADFEGWSHRDNCIHNEKHSPSEATMPACARCGRSDRPLYRANAKGVPAVWACETCLSRPPDPEVKRLVSSLSPDTEGGPAPSPSQDRGPALSSSPGSPGSETTDNGGKEGA